MYIGLCLGSTEIFARIINVSGLSSRKWDQTKTKLSSEAATRGVPSKKVFLKIL